MPELPEVETVARDLRRLIVGATIVDARSDWPPLLRTHEPASFATAVAGRTVEAVGRRAKQLLVELSGESVLTIHLKMTGQLFVVPADAPADRHVHLVLALADGREVRFRDIRKFGRVGLYPRDPITGEPLTEAGGAGVFAGHGPEPLADTFTLRVFRERLRARRGRLKPLLLDQTFLAGVGNIYADEALWRARLHPLRSVPSLRRQHDARLYAAVRGVLAEAVERRGSSIDDYTAPEGDGSMQERLQVYQRAGEACPRCGRPVRRIVVGGRATHFCSWCQRLPAADRAAARALLGPARAPGHGRVGSPVRPGPRWTGLTGTNALGRTTLEELRVAERARRIEATRRAAATRRAWARTGAGLGDPSTVPIDDASA
ncbi:MAG: bifunctional DNA-formamidopyrimidine glycosylase/DNA-(apurinic or apyrimidinic site) lyase [Candidatus Limnocylindrales bacterium]